LLSADIAGGCPIMPIAVAAIAEVRKKSRLFMEEVRLPVEPLPL
jgi:hypothetical protein